MSTAFRAHPRAGAAALRHARPADRLRRLRTRLGCTVSLLVAAASGCGDDPHTLLPASPGLPRYQEGGAIPVPGGIVNAVGGNLWLRRVDLSIDTRLGTREIGASYNSSTRAWLWTFDVTYDGHTFVDPTGASFAVAGIADGEPIPGSHWVKIDQARIASAGGLVHVFGPDGRLRAVHWRSGEHPRLVYESQSIAGVERTVAVRQCSTPQDCAPLFDVGYDAEGRVSSLSDRAGRMADFGYHPDGSLAIARDGLDTESGLPGHRYEYYDGGSLASVTTSEGERVEYTWHWKQGRITQVRSVGAGDPTHVFAYAREAAGPTPFRTTYVDPLGHARVYLYDGDRRIHRIELATGERIEREWSGRRLAREERPGGVTTTWEFAGDHELIRTDPSGNPVHVHFRAGPAENRGEPFRRPIDRIEDALGTVERWGYDGSGRVAWIENGASERTRFSWNAENMLASVTTPAGVARAFSGYGEHGHPTRIERAGEVANLLYDAVGNLVSATGAPGFDLRPGGELSRGYDADRNLARVELSGLDPQSPATAAAIELSYRSDGGLLAVTRPWGGDHAFAYDVLGRLVERRERADGVWHTTHFEVDDLGRVTAVGLPNGMRRETLYDAAGRVAGLRALRSGALEGSLALTWVDGRIAALEDSLRPGTERYEYDSAGRIARIEYPGGEALELAHDPRDRRSTAVYRSAQGVVLREIHYGYDAANRLATLDEADGPLLTRVYEDGRPRYTLTGNGLVRTLSYDAATGFPSGALAVHPLLGTVEDTAISRRVDPTTGDLELVVDTETRGALPARTREEFALSASSVPDSPGARLAEFADGDAAVAYAYDALSNLIGSGSRSHGYNPERNRLVRTEDGAGGTATLDYEYDEAGYVTRRGGVPIDWNALGFIRSIGDRASFEWDMQGRPLRRVVEGRETHFAFGGSVEADAAGDPLRLVIEDVEILLDSDAHRYRHRDFRGNVKLVSDEAGNPVAHYAYGPYGVEALFGRSDGAATFAGGVDLGDLIVIGNRVHDASAARALSPDPILQLINQYAYAHGNPVSFWDPQGLAPRVSPAVAQAETDEAIAAGKVLLGCGIAVLGGIASLQSPPLGLSIVVLGTGLVIDGTFEYIRARRHGEIAREQAEDGGGSSAAPSPPTSSSSAISPGVFGGPPPFAHFAPTEEGGGSDPGAAAELSGARLGFAFSIGFGGFGGF